MTNKYQPIKYAWLLGYKYPNRLSTNKCIHVYINNKLPIT